MSWFSSFFVTTCVWLKWEESGHSCFSKSDLFKLICFFSFHNVMQRKSKGHSDWWHRGSVWRHTDSELLSYISVLQMLSPQCLSQWVLTHHSTSRLTKSHWAVNPTPLMESGHSKAFLRTAFSYHNVLPTGQIHLNVTFPQKRKLMQCFGVSLDQENWAMPSTWLFSFHFS